jgi:hypothetical protein
MDQSQPGSVMPPPRPKNWLVESILVTIFCCLPFGIVGIVYSSSVNTKYDTGDYAGALAQSQQAGKWTKIGFWIGLACVVLYFILIFAVGVSFLPWARMHAQ